MGDFDKTAWSGEEALRLGAAILATTRDAVIITDFAPKILAVNPAFTEITGYGEGEVLGENPRLLRSGRHDRAFYQAMWAGLLETGHWQGEIWNRRKNGEIYPEWLTISVVRNEQGDPTHYLGVATDLSQLRLNEERLQRLVHYDPLTSLPNRLLLEARLQHTLERASREGNRAAVLVIDLDQFKTINDSHGHAAGDALLVAVTQRLKTRLREEDTLSRLAGDQFVLVLEALHEYQESEIMARRIQESLEEPFILPDGCKAYVRASVGISVYPQDGATAQALLLGADSAVHRAKEQGGRQFCYYTSEFNAQARATLVMEEALRRALAQEEFVLYYQPKVDLRSGRIVGAEALVRWQRPDCGLVPPLQFIPAAEKNGLIEAIGAWVIRDACRQMSAWREAGLAEIKVAVNVSPRQFRLGGLEEEVVKALAHYGVEPRHLMLELTESMLMAEPEEAVARMTALKRIGVCLSLDDFGTGYSSLAYLSRFPIDQMKIDRSFVTDIVTDPGAATIATSVIALAHRMRLGVVAEGVETEAQAGYLRQNGCDEIQGYLFSKPVPAEEFAELLRQGKTLPTPEEPPIQARSLLLVDDEPHILAALQRVLADEGYLVLTAASGHEGLELLAKNPVQVILSDQRMPGMSGTEFLGRVKALYPETVRMVLSGYAELETVLQAVNEGAIYKFFGKPWDAEQLPVQIRDAFLYHEGVIQLREAMAPVSLGKERSGWLEAKQEHEALKQLFSQVKRAKDEWTMAMDGVSDLVLLLNAAGEVQRCNKAVCDFLGKPYAEILGRPWEALFAEAGMRPGSEQADLFQGERFHEPSNRFFQQVCYTPEAENGETRRVVTLHDISERKRILLRIEQDRKRLEGALGEISTMIQRVTHGNGGEVFFTLPPDHEPCWKMMDCGQEGCVCFGREPLQCWTIAGTRCKGKVQGKFAQKFNNCLACEFYQEAADDPVVRIGIQFSHMMQIIDKKNSELQDAFDELKATQSQFVQHEKMASIGQLAAGVAHEINNPIGFVTSNLGTLQKYTARVAEFLKMQAELFPQEAGDERATRLGEIRRQLKIEPILEDLPSLIAESLDGVERVRKIVQNLKSFSRIDQSDYSLADINQCLDDTLNIIWNELKYKCTVKKDYGDLPPTKCYPQQLNQVFMNLLVNAAQAIETKGEIVISTRASETEITIAIADSGSGIPQENLNRIFEPFYTTKEVGKGTGLGLSITYDIVTKKHGGKIEVTSEPGQGTTFVVTLPVKAE